LLNFINILKNKYCKQRCRGHCRVRAANELCTDKHMFHSSTWTSSIHRRRGQQGQAPFVQARWHCAESTCSKPIFQVFQFFQRYVTRVSYEYCKSRSGCYICCNGYTLMLQTPLPNVSFVFFRHMFQACFIRPDVAYILHICCKCFIWTLLCFAMVANIFFLVFHTYVVSVSYRYYKSRFGVAHVALEPICNSHLLQLLGLPAVRAQDTKWRRPRYGHVTQCGASTHMMQERASRRPDARHSGPICYRPY
jgi:hypothetical protein